MFISKDSEKINSIYHNINTWTNFLGTNNRKTLLWNIKKITTDYIGYCTIIKYNYLRPRTKALAITNLDCYLKIKVYLEIQKKLLLT